MFTFLKTFFNELKHFVCYNLVHFELLIYVSCAHEDYLFTCKMKTGLHALT